MNAVNEYGGGEEEPEEPTYTPEPQIVARQPANQRVIQVKKKEEDDWGSGGIDDANMGL